MPRQENTTPDLLLGTQRRIEGTFYLLLIPFLALAGRLVELQAMHKAGARGIAPSPHIFRVEKPLPALRGAILAADGTAMAVTVDEYTICANPRAITAADKVTLSEVLEKTIGGTADQYEAELARTSHANGAKIQSVVLAKRVTAEQDDQLKAIMRGDPKHETREQRIHRQTLWQQVTLDPAPRRNYPLGSFASQVVGFTTDAGKGVEGLELAAQKRLAGKPGRLAAQVDAQGRPLPALVKAWQTQVAGETVVTTIDPKIQANTDEVLDRLVERYKPNFATAIVMKPSTGEVVAMSTAPSFDPNARRAGVQDVATNRCMTYAYEPGSTFKIITASAAVENVSDWRTHTFYCNGVQMVGKHLMHCWINSTAQKRHGLETLSTSIRDSCNFGMYGFARLVGADKMLEYAKKFGLGQRVHLDGMQDSSGLLPRNRPRDWSQEQLANFSFGQGMLMTPLQLIRVAACIANGGVMMRPMLVKELRDENGNVVKEFTPEVDRRVIAESTAHEVTAMMKRVTAEGTARKYVFVPGYVTAGKTGSAQKAVGPHGYAAGKFISSFVGFLPADNPEYVILVMADEPHGSHWGSEVCGPAFADIASDAMLNLRLAKGTDAPHPASDMLTRPKSPVEKKS